MARRTPEERNHGRSVSRSSKNGSPDNPKSDWDWVVWSADQDFRNGVLRKLEAHDLGSQLEEVAMSLQTLGMQMRLKHMPEEESWMLLLLKVSEGDGEPTKAASVWHSDLDRLFAGAGYLLDIWMAHGGLPLRANRGDW